MANAQVAVEHSAILSRWQTITLDYFDTLVTEAGTRWMAEEQVIDDTTVIVANLFGWRS